MTYRTILSISTALGVASAASTGTAAVAQNPAAIISSAAVETALAALPASETGAEVDLKGYIEPVEPQSDLAGIDLGQLDEGFAAVTGETFEQAANAAKGEAIINTSAIAAAQYSGAEAGSNGGREDSFTVLLNQDSFFGFYPSFNGLIPVSENVDFSFYGILWTTTSFGNGGGNDLWTEFGVGAAFYSMEGNLVIKPQIGLTNGALLSRGVRDANDVPTGTGGNFADGIVPSLTINYSDDAFEAEFYGGYYAALRNRNDPGSLDFLHTWVNAGAKFSDKISAGVHYELLDNSRVEGGQGSVVYQWLGPYVQFKTDNGFFARFTAGPDIEDGGDGDFYKLTAGFSF